jgi:hypothetical protein
MYQPGNFPAKGFITEKGIAMILKNIVGAGVIAGAIGFSAIGLAGVANAAPTPQAAPGVVHQAQLADWGGGRGGGFHGGGGGGGFRGGRGFGGPGIGGRGFGGPGFRGGPGFGGRGFGGPGGWGGPPCLIGLCI